MTAVYTPLTVEQGADWSHGWGVTLAGQPLPPGEWTAVAQIRPRAGSPMLLGAMVATVDLATSTVTVTVPAATSSGWDWTHGEYDVTLTDGARTFRVAEGPVTVDLQVTVP